MIALSCHGTVKDGAFAGGDGDFFIRPLRKLSGSFCAVTPLAPIPRLGLFWMSDMALQFDELEMFRLSARDFSFERFEWDGVLPGEKRHGDGTPPLPHCHAHSYPPTWRYLESTRPPNPNGRMMSPTSSQIPSCWQGQHHLPAMYYCTHKFHPRACPVSAPPQRPRAA